jgi:hypothetical protein
MIARVWEHIKPEAVVLFYVHGNDQWTNARSDYFYPHVTLSPAGELRFDPASPEHEVPWYRRMTLWRWLDEKILHGKDLIYLAQRIEFAWRKENAYSWRVTEAILRKLADYVGKKGAKLIIVDVPNLGEETVFAGSLAREALLEKLCWSLSVPYYNLRNYYGRNPDSLLVPGDTHWNASGHAFIADRVEEWLAKNGLMTRGTGG